MKLHIFRLSGHDFVHYRKIEIGANDRAVYQQSISCFIVYANFDWFLIKLYSRKMMTKKQTNAIMFAYRYDNYFFLISSCLFLFNGGTEMTFYEQMVPLLSNLLEIGETLKAPIYGTLLQKNEITHLDI